MIRLHIIAEGQTERNFVKSVLAPHLAAFKVFADARCVLTSKDRRTSKKHSGGGNSFEKAQRDIQTWIKEDKHGECRFTTMFDLYSLPEDFPDYAVAIRKTDPYERVHLLEESLARSISDRRFIPYIQLHEFEALILAAPQNLSCEYLEHDTPIKNLVSMVSMAPDKNPELIDDGRETAPSKRILRQIPEYRKTTAGVSVVKSIGLPTLRTKCRHFNDWLSRLEQLAAGVAS